MNFNIIFKIILWMLLRVGGSLAQGIDPVKRVFFCNEGDICQSSPKESLSSSMLVCEMQISLITPYNLSFEHCHP